MENTASKSNSILLIFFTIFLHGCILIEHSSRVSSTGVITDEITWKIDEKFNYWYTDQILGSWCQHAHSVLSTMEWGMNIETSLVSEESHKLKKACRLKIGPYRPNLRSASALSRLGILLDPMPNGYRYTIPNIFDDHYLKSNIMNEILKDIHRQLFPLGKKSSDMPNKVIAQNEYNRMINEIRWKFTLHGEGKNQVKIVLPQINNEKQETNRLNLWPKSLSPDNSKKLSGDSDALLVWTFGEN